MAMQTVYPLEGGAQMKGEMHRTVMICVDSYDDRIPSGRFHIASDQDAQSFRGLCQLLTGINQYLDREKFPQSFSELRNFQNPSLRETGLPSSNLKPGKLATFSVRILFRQNASWQGMVTWVEGKQVEYFRSVLELIVLMDNAMGFSGE